MNEIDTSFNHSFAAWEIWNQTEVDHRYAKLEQFVEGLPDGIISAAKFQLKQSYEVVSKVYNFIGPTGETNELYISGRGVAVLAVDSVHENSTCAVIAILVAMLSAGNSAIICCDDDTLSQVLMDDVHKEELLGKMIQCIPFSSYNGLLEKDIKNFAYVGNTQGEREINKLLALRTGAITALVSETDLDGLQQAQDPKLVLRFVTERTRTVNITAVGGNATLLELGSGAK